MIITGLRGVGKTVLLGQFRVKGLEREWVVVELEVSKHDDAEFRRDISTRLRSALLELSRRRDGRIDSATRPRCSNPSRSAWTPAGSVSAGLDVEAAEGFADHSDLALDLIDVLLAFGEAAQERGP